MLSNIFLTVYINFFYCDIIITGKFGEYCIWQMKHLNKSTGKLIILAKFTKIAKIIKTLANFSCYTAQLNGQGMGRVSNTFCAALFNNLTNVLNFLDLLLQFIVYTSPRLYICTPKAHCTNAQWMQSLEACGINAGNLQMQHIYLV